jgi:hypothetical protein
MQFTVGLKTKGKADRIVVDAEDALIAALKVKTEQPEAVIMYVRASCKTPASSRVGNVAGSVVGALLVYFVA